MITGILVALPEELATLTSLKIQQGECITMPNGTLIALSGAGTENAQAAVQKLIAQGAQQLISWGCAGALAPHLVAGDLILPHAILLSDQSILKTNTTWRDTIAQTLDASVNYYSEALLESELIISTALDKANTYQQTQAFAVDMESGTVARAAQQVNIPFIAIRSIVDPANFSLPYAVQHAMNHQGTVSISKLLIYLCTHPTELPSLIKLGRHFNAAKKTLSLAASHLSFAGQA